MVKKIVLFIRDCCIVMFMHDDVECERFYGSMVEVEVTVMQKMMMEMKW